MAKSIKIFRDIKISADTITIVRLLSNGETVVDIADRLKINKRTMEGKISAIKNMFDVLTLPHLVAFFLRNKLIK